MSKSRVVGFLGSLPSSCPPSSSSLSSLTTTSRQPIHSTAAIARGALASPWHFLSFYLTPTGPVVRSLPRYQHRKKYISCKPQALNPSRMKSPKRPGCVFLQNETDTQLINLTSSNPSSLGRAFPLACPSGTSIPAPILVMLPFRLPCLLFLLSCLPPSLRVLSIHLLAVTLNHLPSATLIIGAALLSRPV